MGGENDDEVSLIFQGISSKVGSFSSENPTLFISRKCSLNKKSNISPSLSFTRTLMLSITFSLISTLVSQSSSSRTRRRTTAFRPIGVSSLFTYFLPSFSYLIMPLISSIFLFPLSLSYINFPSLLLSLPQVAQMRVDAVRARLNSSTGYPNPASSRSEALPSQTPFSSASSSSSAPAYVLSKDHLFSIFWLNYFHIFSYFLLLPLTEPSNRRVCENLRQKSVLSPFSLSLTHTQTLTLTLSLFILSPFHLLSDLRGSEASQRQSSTFSQRSSASSVAESKQSFAYFIFPNIYLFISIPI